MHATSLDRLRRTGDALAYELVGYEPHMHRLFERAQVAVCRAGAGTVAELTAAGLPAVLVPLPGAPSDHQAQNATTLAGAGAVVVVPDAECDAARLDAIVSGAARRPGATRRDGRRPPRLGASRRGRRGSPTSSSRSPMNGDPSSAPLKRSPSNCRCST